MRRNRSFFLVFNDDGFLPKTAVKVYFRQNLGIDKRVYLSVDSKNRILDLECQVIQPTVFNGDVKIVVFLRHQDNRLCSFEKRGLNETWLE